MYVCALHDILFLVLVEARITQCTAVRYPASIHTWSKANGFFWSGRFPTASSGSSGRTSSAAVVVVVVVLYPLACPGATMGWLPAVAMLLEVPDLPSPVSAARGQSTAVYVHDFLFVRALHMPLSYV